MVKTVNHTYSTEIASLISLVEDPDERVFNHVKERLIEMGNEIIPALELSWDDHLCDALFQERVTEIVRHIRVDEIKTELMKWRESSNRDLLKGSLIISKFQFPDINQERINQELEKIKQKVWLEINEEHTAFEIVKIFNHVLFDICGFESSENSVYAPQHSCINTVLESKKGNQLSLSILYSIIAQKLQIPIYGINLPNHFVLGFMDKFQTLKMLGLGDDERNVLFYINPFSKGRIFDQNEIENYLRSLNLPLRNNYFEPCTNTDILKRQLNNLAFAYDKAGEFKKVEELNAIKAVLEH